MNERLNGILNQIFEYLVLLGAFFLPLFFWNLTSEYYETPKYLLLLTILGILLILWVAKWAVSGKITFTRTPLDLPLIMLMIVLGVSSFFSASKAVAILGNFPRLHGGLLTYATYILFYFVLVSNLKKVSTAQKILNLLLISGVVLSVITLFSYFGQPIFPWSFTQASNFTPTGMSFSTAAILALLLPLPLVAILKDSDSKTKQPLDSSIEGAASKKDLALNQLVRHLFWAIVLTLFILTIVLIGSWPTLAAAVLVYLLIIIYTPSTSLKKNFSFVLTPVLVGAAAFILTTLPLGGKTNILYTQAQNFPRVIQLPLEASWKISISAFRDAPFWGTGPASYLFDFTAYKPLELNATQFWNKRSDQAFNEYLYLLATTGALGLLSLMLLTVIFISSALKSLKSPQGNISKVLCLSGLVFFTLLALHPTTLTLWVVGILILASFMIINKDLTQQIHLGISTFHHPQKPELRFDALPIILSLLVIIPLGVVLFFAGKFTLADFYHRKALNAVASGNALGAYDQLIKSERLNPYIDLYRIDSAQTNFALANAIATSKIPPQATPGATLSAEDKQDIQTLISQAINEGKVAVTLSPNNPANWEILGSIYREISGVAQNALAFSLDSYGRAIQKDPLNPLLRLTVGGIYYQIKNYDMAVRFFTDAINLKPDFANAYYNLAIALKDKGDLSGATAAAEKTISLLKPEDNDYTTASELLNNLKTQVSNQQLEQQRAEQEASAAAKSPAKTKKATSGLENESLPKVVNLPKPENIATPPAVKKTQE
ncbi:MAG: hypothetical protein UU73_C0006G0046 [Candidatus Daviesbacteria bacterium GW2011_GWA1_41_61]|uniref:O-antigen ligase-related domain-containing protein n=1 Tax=Candidatus Daviesbacteria bacterium GW2011_GWA2_40_9 TaxID=1618424 RepID=A0A0G0X2R7_9BACT|nr:MAG: hypothetical protein UU26_C0040G0004 [Candidatus Daviesbacteria bacterium GW2011_GWC1_40_9]KKR81907.1 MAG: hypothetical protein UU29_C0021G0002 [Candidatus Daviesbacteria bacterium GW2011_GWA2_40_9]KKR92395.1 MAG: hypothetical protein UU44_C0006G0046 [Candidatus Daviesbacteria bacterium GW2011_GWB1_41_15]KKS14583.1 MAG: hypothetical protein UU73_C0006G0046 [Candidatus Daviesbacteria bacterium GW2011_GWA1_41_61]